MQQFGIERSQRHRRVPQARHRLRLRTERYHHEPRQAVAARVSVGYDAGDDECGIVRPYEADQLDGLSSRQQGRARNDDGELRDEEERVGRLRGVVQLAARGFGEPQLNPPNQVGRPIGELRLRPGPVVDAERTGCALGRPVLVRGVGKVVAQRKNARLATLRGEHHRDGFGRADGMRKVLWPLDLNFKTDGGVAGRRAFLESSDGDARNATVYGSGQFPRCHGNKVVRRFNRLPELGPPAVKSHATPRAPGSTRCWPCRRWPTPSTSARRDL
ncbi:hypothetical protein G6321_00003355 (plasmid) [Bradyrhizobium barranii subsp. barranii]|uniref:Uncharacterized protein n=1 Tax=Bradyrhizobium barranii subsp. barranii TaxID=2823807 RepID=A0A9X9YFY1_9BRAD|nr:hypothetical protein [Bradyrhizobium barranii]UGX89836.1 hypothetical protein G6321_00003355 [Bradyrhizobium barranii subsp. barranii]